MDLVFLEDNIANGTKIELPASAARAIFVTAGSVCFDGSVFITDSGFTSAGTIHLTAGPEGASLWRWEIDGADDNSPGHRAERRLSGPVPDTLTKDEPFLRLDSVSFPPEGTAMLHTHKGPGIRCLREGSIRIDTLGHSTAYGPGGSWYEAGPDPVFAQADMQIPSRFIRAMVLPKALRGISSIRYEREEDRDKSKSQSYKNFGEIGIT